MENKFAFSLLLGAIGDSLGYSVEFKSNVEIKELYGSNGITDLINGQISDDTQMTIFTLFGILNGGTIKDFHESYLNWLTTQNDKYQVNSEFPRELFNRRAPGITCLTALSSGKVGYMNKPINNSKGCGGIMRVAPIGLYYHKDAKVAFTKACEAAAITHSHASGFLAAGVLAAIISELLNGFSIRNAITNACTILKNYANHEEVLVAVEKAVAFSGSAIEINRILGEGWIAEETLAIALYCVLFEHDIKRCLILAVNHDGDSDSTGAVTGNLLGVMHDSGKILKEVPLEWRNKLELGDYILDCSENLFVKYTSEHSIK